jgi:hypothetical protein
LYRSSFSKMVLLLVVGLSAVSLTLILPVSVPSVTTQVATSIASYTSTLSRVSSIRYTELATKTYYNYWTVTHTDEAPNGWIWCVTNPLTGACKYTVSSEYYTYTETTTLATAYSTSTSNYVGEHPYTDLILTQDTSTFYNTIVTSTAMQTPLNAALGISHIDLIVILATVAAFAVLVIILRSGWPSNRRPVLPLTRPARGVVMRMPSTQFCINCGNDLRPYSKFCTKCGAKRP